MNIECGFCGYTWNYKGIKLKVQCIKCLKLLPVPQKYEEFKNKIEAEEEFNKVVFK